MKAVAPLPGDPGFRDAMRKATRDGAITSQEFYERGLLHDLVVRANGAKAEDVKPRHPQLINADVAVENDPVRLAIEAEAAGAGLRQAEQARFTVVTARELCAQPDVPGAEELLGPLVRRGQRTIIGAHTGEGKTVKTRQLVRAIVNGEEYLDWKGVGGVRALIIDAEQEAWTIRGQLRDLHLDQCDGIDYLCVPDGLALDEDGDDRAGLEHVLAEGGYAAVVADPLYKLHRGDSNDERAAVDLMRTFDAWRALYGFALLMPVHCRKPQQPGRALTIHDLFGSSAYVRGAEVVLGLQLIRDGYSRLHFLKSRDPGLPVRTRWGLLYDRESGFRRDPKDGQPTTAERLSELRTADPEITQALAAEALGVTTRTIERHWKAADPATQESLLDEGSE